jgi:hypothetical protein
MKRYKVEFAYGTTMWDNLIVEAENKEAAEEAALDQIAVLYPEATDVDVSSVKETDEEVPVDNYA